MNRRKIEQLKKQKQALHKVSVYRIFSPHFELCKLLAKKRSSMHRRIMQAIKES